MLKKLSFLDAHERLSQYEACVALLRGILSECELEVIHDALNHYAQTPALQGCDEEADYAALFALALSQAGYNQLLPEFDVTRAFVRAPQDA